MQNTHTHKEENNYFNLQGSRSSAGTTPDHKGGMGCGGWPVFRYQNPNSNNKDDPAVRLLKTAGNEMCKNV